MNKRTVKLLTKVASRSRALAVRMYGRNAPVVDFLGALKREWNATPWNLRAALRRKHERSLGNAS